jgi:hypothetical protein
VIRSGSPGTVIPERDDSATKCGHASPSFDERKLLYLKIEYYPPVERTPTHRLENSHPGGLNPHALSRPEIRSSAPIAQHISKPITLSDLMNVDDLRRLRPQMRPRHHSHRLGAAARSVVVVRVVASNVEEVSWGFDSHSPLV